MAQHIFSCIVYVFCEESLLKGTLFVQPRFSGGRKSLVPDEGHRFGERNLRRFFFWVTGEMWLLALCVSPTICRICAWFVWQHCTLATASRILSILPKSFVCWNGAESDTMDLSMRLLRFDCYDSVSKIRIFVKISGISMPKAFAGVDCIVNDFACFHALQMFDFSPRNQSGE